MKQKLLQLKDFLVEVLLYGFRVLIGCFHAILVETETLLDKLDILVNQEIVVVEAEAKADATPPAPPAA
jgi:hypothetical protein